MSQEQDQAHFYTELLRAIQACVERGVPKDCIDDLAIGCGIDRRDVETILKMKKAA